MDTSNEISIKEYIMRDAGEFRASYNKEFEFYILVKNGEVGKIKNICSEPFSEKKGLGKLCENPLQNLKYHFVITAALIARYCIEGGMPHETAYNLSDLYIGKADKCKSAGALSRLHAEMSLDYAKRMNALRKSKIFSKPVVMCVNYICENPARKITLSGLAEKTGLNQSYLSRLFKKEMGCSVTEYITAKKIEAAENMLKFSEYPPSEIAFLLGFPSQSYFTAVFRRLSGTTPKKYRNEHFRKVELSEK